MDIDLLNKLFEYKDGNLYRKKTTSPNAIAGQKVGTDCKHYVRVTINKKPYKLHRLIFMMNYGYLPSIIDHIDGNPHNNNIENLRPATAQENNRNKKANINTVSKCKNVTWHKKLKKWQVGLKISNEFKYIGIFDDLELADLVAHEARNKYFKQFARHK
jgi:hypothetical protein